MQKTVTLTLCLLLTAVPCHADTNGLYEIIIGALAIIVGFYLALALTSIVYYKRIARYGSGNRGLQILSWSLFVLSVLPIALIDILSLLVFLPGLLVALLLLSAELKRKALTMKAHAILFSARSLCFVILVNTVFRNLLSSSGMLSILLIAINIVVYNYLVQLYFKDYLARAYGTLRRTFCILYAVIFMFAGFLTQMRLLPLWITQQISSSNRNVHVMYDVDTLLMSFFNLLIHVFLGYLIGVLCYKRLSKIDSTS